MGHACNGAIALLQFPVIYCQLLHHKAVRCVLSRFLWNYAALVRMCGLNVPRDWSLKRTRLRLY